MLPDEPKGWRRLWEAAQAEKDPKKLAELIDQLNQLLSEHEKAAEDETRPRNRPLRQRAGQRPI